MANPAAAGIDINFVAPFEDRSCEVMPTVVDTPIERLLSKNGVKTAHPCSDAVFVRRVYIDLIGRPPTRAEAEAFLDQNDRDKRSLLIDALLEHPEFADYWALKWSDALRIKAEFPINLWPNAVQAYHRWIYQSIRDNKPYDQFARELLTASGSNFRVPPANFYRAAQGREPEDLAGAAALTFMGTRLEHWPEDKRADLAMVFSRVAFKKTEEWKEEIVYLAPEPYAPLDIVLPDGTEVTVIAGQDPRAAFADWLIRPENPWFATAISNRVWYWLMGRGIIHEADDIRPDNPPSNPELLTCLNRELVDSGYDLRHLFRVILNSRAYQRSSIPQSDHPEADALFARYLPRRLEAETLRDAINALGENGDLYQSPIPEPFTWIPETQRAVQLADGSITSPFLDLFGRPGRNTGQLNERNNEPSVAQRVYLLNSGELQKQIAQSPVLAEARREAKNDHEEIVHNYYLTLLSRPPTRQELEAAVAYAETNRGFGGRAAADDLAWALINSKEFLYRH